MVSKYSVFEVPEPAAGGSCRCASCSQTESESDAEFGQWLRKTLRAAGVAIGMGLATVPNPQMRNISRGVATAITGRTKERDKRERQTRSRMRRGGRSAGPPDQEYVPSATRGGFEQAARAGDWRNAYLKLNGLNMFEMLRALDALAPDVRSTLWANRNEFAGMVNMPRIAYAHSVVRSCALPAPVGDLQVTGQVADAANFIAEKLLPVAQRVNNQALPHMSLILQACRQYDITDKSQIAYVLASAHHESAMGRQMVENASGTAYEGRRDLGNRVAGDGPRYKGRGYVQITGRRNYTRYAQLLSVDLVGSPSRATEPAIAAQILAHGMRHGTFTGRRLAEFGADASYDFVNARRIVNGLDRAQAIAAIARRYRAALC
jgi:predicted chitinase